MIATRAAAWALLTEHTHSPSLIKHALAVEAAMRHYAERYGEDVELWGATGLIHDFDYEEHPTEEHHPLGTAQALAALGYPAEVVAAVMAHGTRLDAPRDTRMAQVLFAVDELTGLVQACVLVRPDRNIAELQVSSVRKKWKDKAFAKGVNREDIELGARELGVELSEHITQVIAALQGAAHALGLDGAETPAS